METRTTHGSYRDKSRGPSVENGDFGSLGRAGFSNLLFRYVSPLADEALVFWIDDVPAKAPAFDLLDHSCVCI